MELIQRIPLLHNQTVECFFLRSSTSPAGMIMTVHNCLGRVEKNYLQRASEMDSVWTMHAGWRVLGINLDVIM